MSELAARSGLGSRPIAGRWGWFVGLGAAMLAAGVLALGDTMLVTLISTIFIGGMLLVGGVVQMAHAFAMKGWGAFLFALLCGAAYLLGGFVIMAEPVQGSIVITLVLTAALAVGGIARIAIALGHHRDLAGWWLLLLGGVISLGVAAVLYASLPWSGLWVLGTLVAIELIVQGVSWITLGMALRGLHRTA